MVTVQHLVKKIIEQKPFLQEALSKGIVNNAALAEELIPQIEKELKKQVKFSAVNMAARRLAEKLAGSERRSDSHYAQVSRALAELEAQKLIKCLNPEEKTGRFYELTKRGENIKKELK